VNWDLEGLRLLNQGLAHPVVDAIMAAVSVLAMPALALLPVPFLQARRWVARSLIAILVLSLLISVGIQLALGRPRPSGVRLLLPQPLFASFPSGHAAGVFGYAVFITLVRWRWGFAALGGATLISISRLAVGHHYPSDLLGGAILGAAVGLVVYGCYYRPECERRPRWAWLLWGQVALVLLATLTAWLGLLDLRFLAIPGADKAMHFLLFGLLAFFALGWWARQPAGVIVAPLVLLILIDEGLQCWGAARSFDLLDLAASLNGALVGLGIGVLARQSPGDLSGSSDRPSSQRPAGEGEL
jgi:undecaprenyl-diphosphatase